MVCSPEYIWACLAILRDVGVRCSLRGSWCNFWGAGHDLRGAGCEMLSLILELQTCQLGLRFAKGGQVCTF